MVSRSTIGGVGNAAVYTRSTVLWHRHSSPRVRARCLGWAGCNRGIEYLSRFFFQAEDGIRDLTVTGVQTCALPIFAGASSRAVTAPTIIPSANAINPVLPPSRSLMFSYIIHSFPVCVPCAHERTRPDRKSVV